MNPDVKKKWVEALRSGEYKQAKGRLMKHGGYCCLGVLCKVAADEGIASGRDLERPYLTEQVIQWADLDDIEGPDIMLPDLAGYDSLVTANDGGASFGRIADLIEKHL
jgi:hypothetical protein